MNSFFQLLPRNLRSKNTGFTLVELIVVCVIISVLAVIAVPLAETTIKREKELMLRRHLRSIRSAIDDYKKFVDEHKIEMDEETYGYPEKLEDLVDGIEYQDKDNKSRIQKFLRRIPADPMTSSGEWGLRSYQDKRKASHWGGENVWDIYTKSGATALNGTLYKDW